MPIHNVNVIARMTYYSLWAWVFYFDGLDLSWATRAFLNFLVLADIITWLLYQFYLLPRMMLRFGIGALVNLVVMYLLVKDANLLVPESVDMQAMAVMVFFSVAAVKGFYYTLIEMGYTNNNYL